MMMNIELMDGRIRYCSMCGNKMICITEVFSSATTLNNVSLRCYRCESCGRIEEERILPEYY